MKKVLIFSAVVAVFFSACSQRQAIQKSPCACYEIEILQKDRG